VSGGAQGRTVGAGDEPQSGEAVVIDLDDRRAREAGAVVPSMVTASVMPGKGPLVSWIVPATEK